MILVPATEIKTGKPKNGMSILSFRVDGIPATQGSKRYVGRGRMVEMNKKLPAWRKAVTDAARVVAPETPLDCPVSVQAVFYLPKPQKPRFNVPATPGDLDKYLRALGDGITGTIIKDDARIVHWNAEKRYAVNRKPGADVTVKTVQ